LRGPCRGRFFLPAWLVPTPDLVSAGCDAQTPCVAQPTRGAAHSAHAIAPRIRRSDAPPAGTLLHRSRAGGMATSRIKAPLCLTFRTDDGQGNPARHHKKACSKTHAGKPQRARLFTKTPIWEPPPACAPGHRRDAAFGQQKPERTRAPHKGAANHRPPPW
jgi:hypothetical protein